MDSFIGGTPSTSTNKKILVLSTIGMWQCDYVFLQATDYLAVVEQVSKSVVINQEPTNTVCYYNTQECVITIRKSVLLQYARVCYYNTQECVITIRKSVLLQYARVCYYNTQECVITIRKSVLLQMQECVITIRKSVLLQYARVCYYNMQECVITIRKSV